MDPVDINIQDYVKSGEEWPIYVRPEHIPTRGSSPSQVFPDHLALASSRAGLGRQVGLSGIPVYSGVVDLDYNPNLKPSDWRGSYDRIGIVDRMVREDPVAQAIRMAWTLPILSVPWSVEPASDDAKDIEIADFVKTALFEHMQGGLEGFLEQAVQFTWRGFMLFEIVARYDKVLGRTVIDKLAPLMPWTVFEWKREKDGRWGVEQNAPSDGDGYTSGIGENPTLQADKLIHLTYQPDGNNPEPMGILRPCYGAWKQRRTYLKLEATGYERAAYGIPYVEVDVGASPGDIDQVNIILRELRSGVRAFAMFPRGYTLKFADFPMKGAEIREARIAAGKDMARAALTQFLFTGEQAGAYSLIQGQLDHYTMALQQAANRIAAVLSEGPHSLIKRLVSWNFPNVDKFPVLQPGEVRVGDPKQLVEAIRVAVDGGMLYPDRGIEEKVRQVLSLPARAEVSEEEAPDMGGVDPFEPDKTQSDEDSEQGEDQKEQQHEADEVTATEGCCSPFALAESVIDRVAGDQFMSGPKGRPIRMVEQVVRFSETRGVMDSAKETIGSIIQDWRDDVTAEYAEAVSKKRTVLDATKVPLPRTKELKDRIRDELRKAYLSGTESVISETARLKNDPELRESLEKGDVVRDADGNLEPTYEDFVAPYGMTDTDSWLVSLAKKIKRPKKSRKLEKSPVDDIDPMDLSDDMAEIMVAESVSRAHRATAFELNAAGIAGTMPERGVALAVVEAGLEALTKRTDVAMAQGYSNSMFSIGRVQEQRKQGINKYIYSNMLESNTCTECEKYDGDVFAAEYIDVYMTPATWCLGGSMCNCVVIGIP